MTGDWGDPARVPGAASPRPHPRPVEPAAEPGGWEAFGRRVLALHLVRRDGPSEFPMCTCGSPAILCPYRNLARRFLPGHQTGGGR